MEQVLLKQLLVIECAATQAQEVWNDLSLEQLNRINPADLLTRGIRQPVFGGRLRDVPSKTLLADINACQGSRDEVDRLIEQETEKALGYIEDQYRAVIDHYVPPDITPAKERKLIMSNGALRDVQRLRSEDDNQD
jgi:hypothetical protein